MNPNNHPAIQIPDASSYDGSVEGAVRLSSPNAHVVARPPYYSGGSYGQDSPESPDSEGGLIDYWHILSRHKTAVILTSFGTLLLGFAVGIPMKPVYRARTSIEVLNLNEDFMNMKQTNPVSSNDNTEDLSEAETQTKLLQSDSLLDRVYLKLDPGSQTATTPKMATTGWRSWLHLREPVRLGERAQSLDRIAKSLRVRPTSRTRIIEVTTESTNPELAADFANTLIQEYIQQNLESRFAATHRTSDWLSREIGDARASLKSSEDALQSYARSSGLIFTDENSNVATEKLQQLQQELSAATGDRITKQARFELASHSPPDTVGEVLNDVGLKDTRAKVNDLRRQVADLGAVYTPEFSQLKRVHAELEVLEAAFERTRADIMKRIENDYQEALSREKLLATAYDAQTREVTGQDEKAIQYNILKREVDSSRQLYDTMLQQTKQSSIASALRASNVRIVDPALVPQVPFSPNFKLNSIIGLFAGLFLSIAFVIVREQADRTLQQPGDMKMWTELAELGTIPRASAFARRLYGSVSISGSDRGQGSNMLTSRTKTSVEMITHLQKPSFIAEAFRSVLTSVLFVGENGSRPKVLVFTSPNPAEGKTTVVSNLAIAAAEIRFRVLVIDADLRRPRLHQIFGVQNDRGLSDLLREELTEENTAELIQHTEIPNLHVLPAGQATDAASHLLYSRNFPLLLAKCKREYDMVLIDTPPMLPMTDARVAGRSSDAVILVARAGRTTRDAILAAKERLYEDSIRVLGTVFNDWDPKRAPGGYYGKFKYKVAGNA